MIMGRKLFGLWLGLFVLLAGCSLVNSPKATVQKFVKAIEKNDMKAMAEVATPETVQLMAMFGTKVQGMVAANTSKKVKTVTETINGDTAVVTIVFDDGEDMSFDLVKADGKWKVSISMGK